ncbi:transcription antitermination factor NusB [Candidatus Endowatersipora endosymbiont of Watersipora subatra]|uniref:transcription antitermination factor NusB n=1 Tax=Candidatus Endowatersipora endosymbiont of Watersipora subatra TaxID=3077946 RepID=UPI00312CAB3D
MDIAGTGLKATIEEYENFRLGQELDGNTYLEADASWFRYLLSGVVKGQKTIDPVINNALSNEWPLSRIDSTMRAILRAGVFELIKKKDVVAKVVIVEYVEVAKAFFDGDEPKVINGILDRVARPIRGYELDN